MEEWQENVVGRNKNVDWALERRWERWKDCRLHGRNQVSGLDDFRNFLKTYSNVLFRK